MAYRSFGSEPFAFPPSGDSPTDSGDSAETETFAPLEQTVIALAEADPVASLGAPSRFARLFERWFGFKRHNPLADKRLEALRRFAVLARVAAGRLPAEEVKRFLAAGFSLSQARALQRRAARPVL
ncbi:MAG TPA: hypothetical protein VMG08_01870 [Allosphingosinicella sp.]|nr:hypothetical protein [Allosphingosinicella sp.]